MASAKPGGRTYAAEEMLKHLESVRERIAGVRTAEDVEDVHQMRVATRRLRTAMALFGDFLPDKKTKRWFKAIRRVTRALGDARDTDVKIEFLDRHLASLREKQLSAFVPGVERLRLRLTQRRDRFQAKVVKAMDRLQSSGVLEAMTGALMEIQVQARLGRDEAFDPEHQRQAARRSILHRLRRLLIFEPYVASPDSVEQHHRMRIAAKRFRYALESYAPWYEGALKPFVRLGKQIQSRLGDIHDADVWIKFLPEFLDREARRHQAFFGHRRGFAKIRRGIEHLLEDRRQHRRDLHKQFAAYWENHATDATWQDLRRLLEAPAELGEGPRWVHRPEDPKPAGGEAQAG